MLLWTVAPVFPTWRARALHRLLAAKFSREKSPASKVYARFEGLHRREHFSSVKPSLEHLRGRLSPQVALPPSTSPDLHPIPTSLRRGKKRDLCPAPMPGKNGEMTVALKLRAPWHIRRLSLVFLLRLSQHASRAGAFEMEARG